ncbi:hypothetical protein CEXT_213121 [Caerostris extrusa]|uniref:Uncharacterized protein n=1 Tax=Caerostris extrusa TaxID=172846 RepID=A0AAV4PZ13_CAEEX|nr:hypothetical protein CEXT_213121 [Caerostris extrusa]
MKNYLLEEKKKETFREINSNCVNHLLVDSHSSKSSAKERNALFAVIYDIPFVKCYRAAKRPFTSDIPNPCDRPLKEWRVLQGDKMSPPYSCKRTRSPCLMA